MLPGSLNFIALLKSLWVPLKLDGGNRAGFLFMENLNRVKKETILWAKEKKSREDSEHAGIESWLASMMEGAGMGFQSDVSKVESVQKEKGRREILVDRGELWSLKSRAFWLSSGDENTKVFHAYAKVRKSQNTIWELGNDRGHKDSSFEELSTLAVNHFKQLFSAQQGTSIAEIIKLQVYSLDLSIKKAMKLF